MREYISVKEYTEYEFVIEKSRFIGIIFPIERVEDYIEQLGKIKAKYPLATHYCYAYIVDTLGNEMKMSDDGEPQGTAGMPMLDVLKKRDLKCVAIVVVRYFGGVKLGANGLVGAYIKATVGAIDKAQIVKYIPSTRYTFTFDYQYLKPINIALENLTTTTIDIQYSDKINLTLDIVSEQSDTLLSTLNDITSGKVVSTKIAELYGRY